MISVISFKGNKLTLETRPSQDGIDVREELLQFHSTYYSSNLMGLCVIGRGKTLSFFFFTYGGKKTEKQIFVFTGVTKYLSFKKKQP